MAEEIAPLLTICSYCKKVRFPAGAMEGEWIAPEVYTNRGDIGKTRSSHGVCPSCYDKVIQSIKNP